MTDSNKTYFEFLEFLAERYSVLPSDTVCLKDVKDFLSESSTYNVRLDSSISDILPDDVKDFLAHYKNTHYDARTRSFTIKILMCDVCGNTHYITVYIDGSYTVFDDRGHDITIWQSDWIPMQIKSIEDAREVIFFYENQGK